MRVKCENCNKKFEVTLPVRITTQDGAEAVCFSLRTQGCLYNPAENQLHPFCPHCGFVNVDEELVES